MYTKQLFSEIQGRSVHEWTHNYYYVIQKELSRILMIRRLVGASCKQVKTHNQQPLSLLHKGGVRI
jgi:hypothetical protein